MEHFLDQMAEILEEETVQATDKLQEFEAWDSLTQLSIIALADETYGVTLSADEIRSAATVGGVQKLIESKK